LAQWADIDAFELSNNTLGGSGYDIACAKADQPILYKLEEGKSEYKTVDWKPSFHQSILFAFTGNKRDSREAIGGFNKDSNYSTEIIRLNLLTKTLLKTENIREFMSLLQEHESLIGRLLDQTPVQKKYFPDFPGTIKSLGAWGGDFVMVVSENEELSIRKYLKSRGLDPVFRYEEIVCEA
jgi:mevalonate kinase